jgi:hypothetical protein
MQKLYCFAIEEIKELKSLIGIANHDSSVIEQNINNPKCIEKCTENISTAAIKALELLEGK